MRYLKSLLFLFILMHVSAFLVSCNEEREEISLEDSNVLWVVADNVEANSLTLTREDKFQISLSVYPENAVDKDSYKYSFVSSNPEVAEVSSTGLVTALTAGETTIRVNVVDNEKMSFSIKCIVLKGIVHVEDIVADAEVSAGIELPAPGQTFDLSSHVSLKPIDVNDEVIEFSSSDVTIATVDDAGLVTGVAAGSAVITASSHENPAIKVDIPVTVKALPVIVSLDRSKWDYLDSSTYLKIGDGLTAADVIAKAFDGDEATTVAFDKPGKGNRPATATDNQYFSFDLGAVKELQSFRIVEPSGKNNRACTTHVTIYGKETADASWSAFVTNYEIPNGSTAGGDSGLCPLGSTNVKARYIRVEITGYITTSSNTTEIAEFYLTGYE